MDEQTEAMVADKMAPALISIHPKGAAVVVAIGAALRVFDNLKESAVTFDHGNTSERHAEAIRAVAFNKEGNLFASAGDDKLVKLWNTHSWGCIKTTRVAKKITAVRFSHNSKYVMFADKFGVVSVISTSPMEKPELPIQMLAHCCSIITDLKLSSDGKYIITSDRDFKIRVSIFPDAPPNGAHEIWSFCLGHTSFVTCVAFVGEHSSSLEELLVSGSGDATVRLWDHKTGQLLDTFDTLDVAELSTDQSAEEGLRAVIGVTVSPDGGVVAVIIERYAGVLLLKYDSELKKLKHVQSLALSDQVTPTSIAFDPDGKLWLVAGAAETVDSSERSVTAEEAAAAESRAHAVAEAAVAHVKLICKQIPAPAGGSSGKLESGLSGGEHHWCEYESNLPGGETLLRTLQGSCVDSSLVAVAAEAAELAMRKLMTKRQYSNEQREKRKRFRNDKKLENKRA